LVEKLGTSTSGPSYILHNSRDPTMMALYLNAVFYIKITVRYIVFKIQQFVEFPDFLPSGMNVHIIPCRKEKKSGQFEKKFGLLTTTAYYHHRQGNEF
jgi:hypothetical protein